MDSAARRVRAGDLDFPDMTVTRKTVTILFADVADSTGLGERLDPEAVRGALGTWFDVAREVIEHHGGTVEKFIGDAVMAVFGVPQLHEDDAVRAVRAAQELKIALARVNEELERRRGLRLSIRVGVNTGEVVVGGDAATIATGDAVNTAKRLEEAAPADEIVIGESTMQLVRSVGRFDQLPAIVAKGKSDPVSAWRVVDVDDTSRPFERRFDTRLVGRDTELDQLRGAFRRAAHEHTCALFTLLGPAGIGKSRLARELCDEVADDAHILLGRCLPYGEGITFWPLTEALGTLGDDDAVERILGDSEDAPLVVERLCGLTGRANVASQEAFWAVRKLCEALARERPLVLCFEDIHWAEPTFLDLIEYLARWIRDAPILLLCLARPEFLDHRPTWLSGQETAASTTLTPLSPSAADELLDALGTDGERRERIAEAAEGNPLYAEQMAAMVAEGGDVEGLLTIPPTIQALLSARLDRLTLDERGVVERAAICGKEFWRDAVVDLTPAPARDRVGSTLMSLMRKDLIRPHESTTRPDDAFRFGHVLIRDAAYTAMPKETRVLLHEQFSDWVLEHAREHGSELEEIRGYHLEQAHRFVVELGLADERARELALRAARLLAIAGHRAFARADMPAAVNLLARAAELELDDSERSPVLRELSAALWATGELERAEAMRSTLLDTAVADGDRRIEWYARLDGSARRSLTDEEGADDLERVATEAVDVFHELGDELGLARAYRGLARVARGRCRFADAERAAELALSHAEAAGDTTEVAGIVDLLCTVLLYGPAHAEQASTRCADIAARAQSDRMLVANAESSRAGLEAMCGRFEEARELVARAASTYDELGHRLFRAGLSEVAGWVELLADRPKDAERELRIGYDILCDAGDTMLLGYPALMLAEAVLLQGRDAEGREYAEIGRAAVAADDITDQIVTHSVLARLAATGSDLGAARTEAEVAVELATRTDALVLHADALLLLSELQATTRAVDEARDSAQHAHELYEQKGNVVGVRRAAKLLVTLAPVESAAP